MLYPEIIDSNFFFFYSEIFGAKCSLNSRRTRGGTPAGPTSADVEVRCLHLHQSVSELGPAEAGARRQLGGAAEGGLAVQGGPPLAQGAPA